MYFVKSAESFDYQSKLIKRTFVIMGGLVEKIDLWDGVRRDEVAGSKVSRVSY